MDDELINLLSKFFIIFFCILSAFIVKIVVNYLKKRKCQREKIDNTLLSFQMEHYPEEQAKKGGIGLLQGADVVTTALNLIKSQI